MLIIANAYRRLNLWNANCGASFEWVGRAINPYLGFLTGWLMIATYIVGTVAGVLVLGPSILAVSVQSAGAWASVAIACAVILVMLVLAVVGIRISARAQIGMAVIEYAILIGIAIAGLVWVLSHHAGSYRSPRAGSAWRGHGKGDAVPSCSPSSFTAAGTAPCTSTRRSSTGRSTRAGRQCSQWRRLP